MKKLIFILAMVVAVTITVIAQPPQAFKYQTVVTDNSGNILSNQTVSFRISIRTGSTGGTVVYTETHISTTNLFGVVNLNIGEGTPTIGTFSLIDWSDGSKYMEMELDPTGGTSYVSMGISQMLSVPYALYAENVTSAVSEINDLSDARADTMSVFLGSGAGENYIGTNYTTGLGKNALHANTDRSGLVAVGDFALRNNGLGATGNDQGAYNTALGSKSMYSNTTGYENTASGYQSLYANTWGSGNTATGNMALYSNISGHNNTAHGTKSLYSNTYGDFNTASGYSALYSNQIGAFNTASGYESMYSNTTGHNNTASGTQSLFSNTTGSRNTASGYQSMYSNKVGFDNSASGFQSMYSNTEGYYNTASGVRSLSSNLGGYSNMASGYQSLYSNTWGDLNTASGYRSMYSNTTGNDNTANGVWSMYSNTDGYDNTASGFQSLYANTTGDYRTAFGGNANSTGSYYNNNTGIGYGADCTASNQVRIGSSSVSSIGGYENWSNVSDLRFKDNISEDVEGLSFIQKLRPVTYNLDLHAIDDFFAEHYNERDSSDYPGKYDKENIRYTGFIAQEVEQAAAEAGFDFSGVDRPKNEDDFYGIRYAEFVVPLVKGMQEQQAMIEKQQEMIEELQTEIKILKQK